MLWLCLGPKLSCLNKFQIRSSPDGLIAYISHFNKHVQIQIFWIRFGSILPSWIYLDLIHLFTLFFVICLLKLSKSPFDQILLKFDLVITCSVALLLKWCPALNWGHLRLIISKSLRRFTLFHWLLFLCEYGYGRIFPHLFQIWMWNHIEESTDNRT